jgi:glycerol-3-phosphate dehydrogenase
MAETPSAAPPSNGSPRPAIVGRRAALHALARERFDLLVVGGGITGAGVAREAALTGLRTALVERDDFASGTSSRSSRLVHGGVRYLEHGHLGLVFESCRERRLLLQLAPHLVRPLAFTWPVYRGARVPRWKLRAGLAMYDALALFRNVGRHHGLRRDEVLAREPGLDPDGLTGGAVYWDAATDDTRLTMTTALAALEADAVVANHVAAVAGVHDDRGRLVGIEAEDRLTGDRFSVHARVVVNATGPWSDTTARLTGDAAAARATPAGGLVRGSAGAHIAIPRHRIGNNDALTLISPLDERVVFVLPAGVHAIVGTTERPTSTGPDEIRATDQEVSYLLRTVNARFPFAALTMDDVIAAWSGIRPLAAVRAGERDAGSASREHAIAHRADGLMSVTGGKLTTYRAMAADVLRHAHRESARAGAPFATPREAPASGTSPLPGGDLVSLAATVHEARETVHDVAVAERLAMAYGSRWRNVWGYAQRDHALRERLVPDLPYLLAEVPHAVEREMACTLADVLVRRTHVAFETRDHGRGAAARIAERVGALLGWSDAERARQLGAYEAEVTRVFAVEALPDTPGDAARLPRGSRESLPSFVDHPDTTFLVLA